MPEIVVEGWSTESSSHGRRVLEGYLGLLSAGTAFGGDGGMTNLMPTKIRNILLTVFRPNEGYFYCKCRSLSKSKQNLLAFRGGALNIII